MLPLLAFSAMLQVVAAAVALRPLNVSYTDQDMVLIYQPEIPQINMPPGPSAWNVSYTEITWAERTLRSQGRGYSRHFTTSPGASVSLTFVGTDIYFYGAVGQDTSIGFLVDGARRGAPRPPSPVALPGTPENVTLISAVTGLDYGAHEVALVLDSGSLSISNVTTTLQIQTEAIDASMTDVTQIRVVSPINNRTEGIMKITEDIHPDLQMCFEGPEKPPCFIYQRLNSNNQSARYEFPIVTGTSFLQLLSANDFFGAFYTINVSPQPPHITGDFNGTTRSTWAAPDAIMYQAVLDPTVSYTVSIWPNTGLPGYRVGSFLNLAQIRTYYAACSKCTSEQKNTDERPPVTQPTPSAVAAPQIKSKSGSSTGAIAGGVVGGVVGLTLLGLLLFFLCRRKKHKRESYTGSKELMEEDFDREMPAPTPLITPPPAPPSDYPMTAVSPISGVRSPTDTTWSSAIDTTVTDWSEPGVSKARYVSAAPLPPPRSYTTSSSGHTGPPSSSMPSEPERHVEQLADAGRIVEYVPPRYDEVWQHEEPSSSAR